MKYHYLTVIDYIRGAHIKVSNDRKFDSRLGSGCRHIQLYENTTELAKATPKGMGYIAMKIDTSIHVTGKEISLFVKRMLDTNRGVKI